MNIEPCPLCGRKAKLWGGHTYSIVQCDNHDCGCSVSVQGHGMDQRAIQRWNRRMQQ